MKKSGENYLWESDQVMDQIWEFVSFVIEYLPIAIFYSIILVIIFYYLKDRRQKQHAILRTHPILGKMRYVFEMIGPEFRQYWFFGDKEGKPVDRDTQETIAKAGKYASTVIGFGSKKDFNKPSFYLSNGMFPKNKEELRVDNAENIPTYVYQILNETLIDRKEKRHKSNIQPWLLQKEDEIVIGKNSPNPFRVNGFIGVSAMSYGALSKSAVKALSQGVAIAAGSYMNTGEGGISPYHLSKMYKPVKEPNQEGIYKKIYHIIDEMGMASNFDLYEKFHKKQEEYASFGTVLQEMIAEGWISESHAPLIFQVGSGLFGARKDGVYNEEEFIKNASRPEVKAIEMKLAQGAKVRGGKLPKEKITPEIAEIRGVGMGKDVESPNRFPLFEDMDGLFHWIEHWKSITKKPVGIKVVAGHRGSFEELVKRMKESGQGPDFITIDGGEGGTGATYQGMADSLGLPIYSGLMILNETLEKYGIRDRVTIIASGMLATADKMAIALALGADLINVARAAMNTIGCINSHRCNTNHCPVGVTTHIPNLEKGLVVEEKRYRTANYLATMRQEVFMLGASCGVPTPASLNKKHVVFHEPNGVVRTVDELHEILEKKAVQ